MKHILSIIFLSISIISFAQKRVFIKDMGLVIKTDSIQTATDAVLGIKSDSVIYSSTLLKTGIPFNTNEGLAFFNFENEKNFIQTSLENTKLYRITPHGGGQSATQLDGVQSVTTAGSNTARSFSTGSLLGRLARVGYTSTTTAGTSGGVRIPVLSVTLGTKINSLDVGGFRWYCRFAIGDASLISGAKTFVGVYGASTSFPTSDPSSLTNIIGIGHNASATNYSIIYGGSSAQTPIDLGSDFPIDLTTVIEFRLYSPKGVDNMVYYSVKNINTGAIKTGTLTASTVGVQLPNPTTLLCPFQMNRTNNATSAAVTIDLINYLCQINY